MVYTIHHYTTYYYSNRVSLCHNLAHLAARTFAWQTCLESDFEIGTPPAVMSTRTDYFGNLETFFTIQEPHRRLAVTALNVVRVHPRVHPEPAATPPWDEVVS